MKKVQKHLTRFKEGGTWFLTEEQYETFLKGKDIWGREDGQFVIPTREAENITKEFLRKIEKKLGLPKGRFGDGGNLIRIDVKNIEKYNPRLPSGKESGADKRFIPGGRTKGGVPEVIIDPVYRGDTERKGLFTIIGPQLEDWVEIEEAPYWIRKSLRKIEDKAKKNRTYYFKGDHFLYKIIYGSSSESIQVFKRLRRRWTQHLNYKKLQANEKPLIIGICGRSCCGKGSIVEYLAKENPNILYIKLDKFFKKHTPEKYKGYDNWECNESLRWDRLIYSIKKLKEGKSTHIPSHRWTEEFDKKIYPRKIIIVEGFLLFTNAELVKLFDKKIFIDVSDINILHRRLIREGNINGIDYIKNVVIPYSKKYEDIQKKNADIIIDGNKSKDEIIKELNKYLKIKI